MVKELQNRDYQDRVVSKAIDFFEDKHKSVMIESPTGSGKTIMALRVLKHFEDLYGYTVNWVAMRRNLLRQVGEANQEFFGLKNLRLVSMFDKNPKKADITVVDEAQHDAASSCVHIHTKSESKVILGLSATPFRTDRLSLSFEKTIKDAGIHRLIQEGWLSQYHHWSIEEYNPDTVATTYLEDPERWGKSVAFFHTIDQCEEFSHILSKNGHHCEVVTGKTNRDKQLDAFDEGQFKIIANVAILTEGFDCPELTSVFCRDSVKVPTMQMAGRGFRIHPDKPHCNIIQSRHSKWQFTRTAKPQAVHVHKHGDWFTLGDSDEVKETVKHNAKKLMEIETEMPNFILKNRKKRKAGMF